MKKKGSLCGLYTNGKVVVLARGVWKSKNVGSRVNFYQALLYFNKPGSLPVKKFKEKYPIEVVGVVLDEG